MKNRIVSIGFLACVFFCPAGTMHAQTQAQALPPEAPVLPMNINFRYVPQYFEQSFSDDPHYARIVAMVNHGQCDLVLLDKATNRETVYSNSGRKASAPADGPNAYTTAIDFTASSTVDSYPLFVFRFHDRFGQEVTWQFVVGEVLPHVSPRVISRTDGGFSITLLYAPSRGAGVAGTALTIGEKTYRLQSTQSNDDPAAFYATDMTVAQILRGTGPWRVESSPAEEVPGGKWDLRGEGGRQRILALEEVSDTEAEVDQSDLDEPDAPQIVLDLQRASGTYGLRSLSVKAHDNTLWIFFGPLLPLPTNKINDKTTVAFTVAENEQATVARGALEVQRTADTEHLLWRFDTPNLARKLTLETGVDLVPSATEQANCMNEECLLRLPNR
jgi:hypothetical protein